MDNKKQNYQKELDNIILNLKGTKKNLFLHSCCAPCSSYCLEYLRNYFNVTLFYFNPNIVEDNEYRKRVEEQKRLIELLNKEENNEIKYMEGEYSPSCFLNTVKGYEQCKEGGERCFLCYELRLKETARQGKLQDMDYFTTTLTISPLKNAAKLNEIGERIGKEGGIAFLPSDFKKKNGYLQSIQLSQKYNLYRQDYCGCPYSKIEREKQLQELEKQKDYDKLMSE